MDTKTQLVDGMASYLAGVAQDLGNFVALEFAEGDIGANPAVDLGISEEFPDPVMINWAAQYDHDFDRLRLTAKDFVRDVTYNGTFKEFVQDGHYYHAEFNSIERNSRGDAEVILRALFEMCGQDTKLIPEDYDGETRVPYLLCSAVTFDEFCQSLAKSCGGRCQSVENCSYLLFIYSVYIMNTANGLDCSDDPCLEIFRQDILSNL